MAIRSLPRVRPRFVVAAIAVCVALPGTAFAWLGREHRAIGNEAYFAACKRLEPLKDRDPQTAQRFEIACGNLQVQAFLYGQANQVSGDWLGDPHDFRTALGASRVTQKSNYYRLALRNSTHFNPMATREWRGLHEEAIKSALAASKQIGAEQLDTFEDAFYASAFGDHFLQDSFAAGHMGFNRPASSAGASHAFHDQWNERGRWVSNRRGETWKTFGDGRLDIPEGKEGRKHVVAAATESTYAVLAAFVLGEYDGAADLAVWREVAFTIEDPEILPDLYRLFGGSQQLTRPELLPLLAVKRDAVKDALFGFWSSFTFPFDNWGNPSGVLVLGGDLIVPGIGMRAEVGAGVGFQGSFTEPRFAIDAGLVKSFGLSFDGLFSHELDFGSVFLISDKLDATLRLSLRTNIEAGDMLLRIDVGPSFNINDTEFGLYCGLGFAKVLHASGGGMF